MNLTEFMEKDIDTKINSYLSHIRSGRALNQRQRVYRGICRYGPISDKRLSKVLLIAKTSVIARRSELCKSGFVVLSGLEEDEITKKWVKTYRVR